MTTRELPVAVIRSLSQIAFSEQAGSGVLIFAAIAITAPWSAVGALIGAFFGTVFGMVLSRLDKDQWRRGLYGVNPAILGILWGGVLTRGDSKVALFIFAILACIAFEHPMRALALRWKMPLLALPALLTGWGSSITFKIFDDSLWVGFGGMPFGFWGGVIAVALVAVVVFVRDFEAAMVTAFYTAATALSAGWLLKDGMIGPVSLWGFAVAPTVMGICLLIPTARKQLWPLSLGGAVVAVLLWYAWDIAVPVGWAPPLMLPLIAVIWAAHAVVRAYSGELATSPLMADTIRTLTRAKAEGRKIVALTGAGISMPSGIPDYVSATWLDPNIPIEEYNYARFIASRAARTAYWEACDHFRELVSKAEPNSAHRAMNAMMDVNWLSGIVTQNVDGLHGCQNISEIHGNIAKVHCVACARPAPWPELGAWLEKDLTCDHCNGYLKPNVIAIGEDPDQMVWEQAKKMVEGCGVLLVIATRMTISTAAVLLAEARRSDAHIIYITKGDIFQTVLEGDIVMPFSAEYTLPTLSRLLGVSPSLNGEPNL